MFKSDIEYENEPSTKYVSIASVNNYSVRNVLAVQQLGFHFGSIPAQYGPYILDDFNCI